jgi:uncharacterized protein (UPF0548 family)
VTPSPLGFAMTGYEIRVGQGTDVFERGVQALRKWQPQRGAGVEVMPRDASVGEDETVILLLRAAGLWAPAPCRVVYVVDQVDSSVSPTGLFPDIPRWARWLSSSAATVPVGSTFA